MGVGGKAVVLVRVVRVVIGVGGPYRPNRLGIDLHTKKKFRAKEVNMACGLSILWIPVQICHAKHQSF